MSDPAEIPPLRHDELVYRRLSREYFDASQRVVKVLAFRPTKADSDGLSLSRQVAGAEGAAASGREGKAFYFAVLRVSDIIDQL